MSKTIELAKHLEKFTKPFQESRIPFVLTEVITDGEGVSLAHKVSVGEDGRGDDQTCHREDDRIRTDEERGGNASDD